MSSNQIPQRPDELFPMAEAIAHGLDLHEAELGVKQNTAAAVRKALKKAREAQQQFQSSRSARSESIGPEFREAELAVTRFLTEARKSLTYHLGARWNERWSEPGFVNRTTAIPGKVAGRATLMNALVEYFSKHPEHELPGLGVTAEIAKQLQERLTAAQRALNSQVAGHGSLREKRDAAFIQLRRRLSAAVGELRLLMDVESQLWEAFGLKVPGRRRRTSKSEPSESLQVVARAA